MTARPSAILLAFVLTTVPSTAHAYQPAEILFTFQDNSIAESSGLASSSQPDILFTHNDSGDQARFFAVGPDGETRATFLIVGAVAVDWEDVARGPGADGSPALFFADIGDNSHVHPFIAIYEVPEPVIDGSSPDDVRTVLARRHVLVYEDLGRHDAETLLVDVAAYGRFAIITKDRLGNSLLFEAEGPPDDPIRVLRRTADLPLWSFAPIVVEPGVEATGGDIAPDRSRFVVRTYWYAFEWILGPDRSLAEALGEAPAVIELPETIQGEAIAYTAGGTDLLISSEGTGAPVHILRG